MDNNSTFFQQSPGFIPVQPASSQQANMSIINDLKQASQYITPENIINSGKSISLFQIPEQTETKNYYQNSISDIKSRMNQLSTLQGSQTNKAKNTENRTANSTTSTQVSNHINNTTTIIHDYVRNIKADYEKMPTWRSLSG